MKGRADSRNMYMDNLKIHDKTKEEMETLMQMVSVFSQDIGLEIEKYEIHLI